MLKYDVKLVEKTIVYSNNIFTVFFHQILYHILTFFVTFV